MAMPANFRALFVSSLLAVTLLQAGCRSAPVIEGAATVNGALVERIAARIPAEVDDRRGWAVDIQSAFVHLGIDPIDENICATLAVIDQESQYQVDPVIPGLGEKTRLQLERRAREKRIPKLALSAALNTVSSDGRTYAKRLEAVRTDGQLSALYAQLLREVPAAAKVLGDFNPVKTAGPMQVPLSDALTRSDTAPADLLGSDIHAALFTRRGGVYFGVERLLGYASPYVRKVHRLGDYYTSRYASRNAAFQQALSSVSGQKITLDGQLLVAGASLDRPGQTELAVRRVMDRLGMDEATVRSELSHGNSLHFSDRPLFVQMFALAEARQGHALPREQLAIGAGDYHSGPAADAYGRYLRCMGSQTSG